MDAVRYKLTIGYDGTNFCGWQKQEPLARAEAARASMTPSDAPSAELAGGAAAATDDAGARSGPATPPAYSSLTPMIESTREGRVALRTVQGVIERALREVCREPGIELVGASRTDSGVHARGQVAAFTSRPQDGGIGWPIERGPDRLAAALNARLPDDVLITDAAITHATFDPVADAVRKRYTYTFHVSRTRPLIDRHTACWLARDRVDANAMHAAAQTIVGEHDFASFATAGHGRLTTVRTVHACDVTSSPGPDREPPSQRVTMSIVGSGFLWNMVRIIAGTLAQVGTGQRTADDVLAILAARDRTKAGPTAKPEGLCLERIWYADDRVATDDKLPA